MIVKRPILGAVLGIVLCTPQCRAQGSEASATGSHDRQSPVHPWCTVGGPVPSAMVLSPDGLGPIKPGLRKAELRRVCPGLRDTVWEGAEGIPQVATLLRLGGQDLGLMEWIGPDSTLSRVLIDVRSVRTTDSVGVGTTVSQLRDRFGVLRAGYDDAGVYVWTDQQPRFSYLLKLRVTSLVKVPDEITRHVDLIPGDARINRLIFVGR
jgi:hypothetical protein